MSVNWHHPYENTNGRWLKGNLHAHRSPQSPCAKIPLEDLLAAYAQAGYDFLSVSDHLFTTIAEHPGLCLIPGMEWNSRAGLMPNKTVSRYDHVGVYGLDPETVSESLRHRMLDELMTPLNGDLIRVLNHPNWLIEEHHDLKTMLRFKDRYDGIEIYNHVLKWDQGQADATWKWDRLLSMGCPVLGFASDDSHDQEDIGFAWIMVRARENSPQQIVAAIKTGNFYCSSGVTILELGRQGATLSIELEAEAQIRVVGSRGRVLTETVGSALQWEFGGHDSAYARFHVRDTAWKQAWSQPFFKDGM